MREVKFDRYKLDEGDKFSPSAIPEINNSGEYPEYLVKVNGTDVHGRQYAGVTVRLTGNQHKNLERFGSNVIGSDFETYTYDTAHGSFIGIRKSKKQSGAKTDFKPASETIKEPGLKEALETIKQSPKGESNEHNNAFSGDQYRKERSMALSYAKDLAVGKVISVSEIEVFAKRFLHFIIKGG